MQFVLNQDSWFKKNNIIFTTGLWIILRPMFHRLLFCQNILAWNCLITKTSLLSLDINYFMKNFAITDTVETTLSRFGIKGELVGIGARPKYFIAKNSRSNFRFRASFRVGLWAIKVHNMFLISQHENGRCCTTTNSQ